MDKPALEARFLMLRRISVFVLCALTLAATLAWASGSSSTLPAKSGAKAASATTTSTTAAKTTTSTTTSSKMMSKKTAAKLDLNSASREDLIKLPVIGEAKADQIIAGRPWKTKRDLVKKGILTEKEYMKVSAMIIAKQAGAKMDMKMESTEKK
jgi:DNA uptake protein ComE-like DNA-binding protein